MPLLAVGAEVVRVNDNDWPPYFFSGNTDEPAGIGKELLERCLPNTGYKYEFNHLPIKRMWQGIQSGDLDINIFSHRPGRNQFLYYGKVPIYTASYRPIVRSKSPIEIGAIDDFDTLALGHLAGLKYSPDFLSYVEKRTENENIHVSNSNHSLMRMLLAGRIDVYVNTRDTVLWNAKRLGVSKEIKVLDYNIRSGDYYVTFSKQSPRVADKKAFLRLIDECLIDLKQSGQYAEILSRYVMR